MPRASRCLLPLLALVATVPLAATDPDLLFAQARALPKERRAEARELCRQALRDHPDYDDVRIHLARLHAWDDQYDEARRELAYVLERRPGNLEAREVAIDVETWADRPHEALRLADAGLALDPRNAQLHYRRARILKGLGDLPRAYESVQAALIQEPGHAKARLLRDDLKELLQRSSVTVGAAVDSFDHTFSDWQTGSVALWHRFQAGSVIARVNRAHRFDSWGTQVEVDAYPKLFEGTYAYLNAGRSDDPMFPSFSAGGELYHNFRGGIEASLGFRHLDFHGSVVNLQTGSAGVYLGNSLVTLRLNRTPSAVGSSLSGSLSERYYLEDADTYLSLSVGTGYSPNQAAWSDQVVRLRSRSASVGGQKRLGRSWVVAAGAGWERQEVRPSEFLVHWTGKLSVERRF